VRVDAAITPWSDEHRRDEHDRDEAHPMTPAAPKRIDMHCHVGLLGDDHPRWGRLSDWYRKQITYRVFLLYGGMRHEDVSDRTLRAATEKAIAECTLDHVVCLALDPVYDESGVRREDRSHMWVDNDYVLDLRRTLGNKVMLGASVHPFDPTFRERVKRYVGLGAVLLKWLPSAQQIPLWHPKVKEGLEFLATAGADDVPLPLLLHVGPEYAIPSSDPRTHSYDFLSWSFWDRLGKWFRGSGGWHVPDVAGIRASLDAAMDAGATIIFAHCGLPYFAPWGAIGRMLEHSDFAVVKHYLERYHPDAGTRGRCYADVSACPTPFRQTYFPDIRALPPAALLFGSDFPTPVFELSAGLEENLRDLGDVLNGKFQSIVVPQGNLIDVNLRELEWAFPGHPMFENGGRLVE